MNYDNDYATIQLSYTLIISKDLHPMCQWYIWTMPDDPDDDELCGVLGLRFLDLFLFLEFLEVWHIASHQTPL